MPTLSIIIPIYNTPVEALERCFDSIASLGDLDYEVLLIDDGSKPFVGDFCRAFVAEHPAFVYEYKENGGVSSARNLGLDRATGQYVMFVDADDEIIGNPIQGSCSNGCSDLILFDMFLSENGADSIWPSLPCEAGSVNKNTFLKQLVVNKSLNSPCVKLFRRTLIEAHQLRFRTDMVTGEDWLFVCLFAEQMGTVTYVKEPCYRYFRDEGSSLNRTARFPDVMIDNHRLIMKTKRHLARLGAPDWSYEDVIGIAAAMHVEDMFNTAADLKLLKLLTKARKKTLQQAVSGTKSELTQSGPRKARMKRFILVHFPIALWPLAKLRAYYLKKKH